MRTQVLDHGYVELVESWGSEEQIIEAARMSTAKGFQGWGPIWCEHCHRTGRVDAEQREGWLGNGVGEARTLEMSCPRCNGTAKQPGDEKLLRYLYEHKHFTPFEMAGMVIEVQAPIFVFREWHRHRTQSYNELSARYTPLPDVNYIPSLNRLMANAGGSNRQAGTVAGSDDITAKAAADFQELLAHHYEDLENTYQLALKAGVPKELARLVIPVGRYSRMRASANLRNWLGFLALRLDTAAQWEIRQFAGAVGELIASKFPRTSMLFLEALEQR